MRDLMKHNPDFTVHDIKLLKVGRHFRLSPSSKLIVGRDEKENDKLLALAEERDLHIRSVSVPGPIGIGRGCFSDAHLNVAARILARYSDIPPDRHLEVEYRRTTEKNESHITVTAIKEEDLFALRI